MASSSEQDFQLLKIVASQLDGLVGLSPSIAKLQTLFKSFIELCEGLVWEAKISAGSTTGNETQPQPLECLEKFVFAPRATDNGQSTFSVPVSGLPSQQVQSNRPAQESAIEFPSENAPQMIDPGWGLFDTQPTLDWLDAGFSYLDSNQ